MRKYYVMKAFLRVCEILRGMGFSSGFVCFVKFFPESIATSRVN